MFLKQKIKGISIGGYFGNSIVNLGDLNGDLYDGKHSNMTIKYKYLYNRIPLRYDDLHLFSKFYIFFPRTLIFFSFTLKAITG